MLWLPLGELLVERGLLSRAQLDLALTEQQRTGIRLGEVLVSMGFVSESVLAGMLLEQVGLAAPAAEQQPAAEPTPLPVPDEETELPPAASSDGDVHHHHEVEQIPEREPEPAPELEPEPEPAPPAATVWEPEPYAPIESDPYYEPEPEPAVFDPEPAPEPDLEPLILRMEDRERGRWWSRKGGNKARVRELEQVLSDFEERSRAIEADIMRVRTTLRHLRDAKS